MYATVLHNIKIILSSKKRKQIIILSKKLYVVCDIQEDPLN